MRINGDDILSALKGLQQPSSPREIAEYLKEQSRTHKSIKTLISEVTDACKAGTRHGFIEACNGLYYSLNVTFQLLDALGEIEQSGKFRYGSMNKSSSYMSLRNHGKHIQDAKAKLAVGGGRFARPKINNNYVKNHAWVEATKEMVEPSSTIPETSSISNNAFKAKRRVRGKVVKKRKPKCLRKNVRKVEIQPKLPKKPKKKNLEKRKGPPKNLLNEDKSVSISSLFSVCKELKNHDAFINEFFASKDQRNKNNHASDYLEFCFQNNNICTCKSDNSLPMNTSKELISSLSNGCKKLSLYLEANKLFSTEDKKVSTSTSENASTVTQNIWPITEYDESIMREMRQLYSPVMKNKGIQCQLLDDKNCLNSTWQIHNSVGNAVHNYNQNGTQNSKMSKKKRKSYKKLPEKYMKTDGTTRKKLKKPIWSSAII
ncbi:uncharacterized protein LOC119685669 isoform X2 [Teleopsis dalmanni]|uniref:uncharacterized protein LOC119685669 isoform X2 n=1 Tax=Teleopsis dalmanni TaxID=139649 RepID=UPI0018CEF411|nr:uncharacterized protein LOC119685669 isoform X2 [Teleopsis dalmanni]